MKKLLLTFTLIFSGCKSVDDQGRLEKVKNKGKGSVNTNVIHSPYGTVNGYPKLMDMIRK